MDGDLQKYLQPECHIYNGDMKYDVKCVTGLSTILVATIQEAKDRISQIEYIFCSQLFPNFQLNSKSLLKRYNKARKAAEDAWKEKETELLLQIEKLQLEKRQALKENHSLKLEKAKLVSVGNRSPNIVYELQKELKQKNIEVAEGRELQENLLKLVESKDSMICSNEKLLREHEEKNNMLLRKQEILELEAEEMQNKLLQLVRSKDSLVVEKEKQLKEHQGKTTELLVKIKSLEEGVDEHQTELRIKTKEVENEKELKETLLSNIESQASKIGYYERLLNDYEKEKELLTIKLESSQQNIDGLREELREKLEKLDKEKKLLLAKVKGLEEKVDKRQMELRVKSNESSEAMELHGKLLKQIELKESELLSEKKKSRDAIEAYKNLKSQYNFLRTKLGLTTEKMLPHNRLEDGSDSIRNNQNPSTSPDIESNVQDNSVACEITKQKGDQENMEDCKGVGSIQRAKSNCPASSESPVSLKCPTNEKPGTLVGSKRSASWRETRSDQSRGGPDPHDDFLDTPLENIRGNLKKAVKEEVHDLPGLAQKIMSLDSSDDETQDMNVDPGPQKQQMPPPRPGTRGFKFVEPVRKKAERENLKGIECKKCKNFYDAVLPDGGGAETDGNKQNLRCEHHEGVSRHRYRYAPPSTPEGFWNIGFESEM